MGLGAEGYSAAAPTSLDMTAVHLGCLSLASVLWKYFRKNPDKAVADTSQLKLFQT